MLGLAERLSSMGEVVSGTAREEGLVEELRGLFEGAGLEVSIHKVECLSWEERSSRIEVEGGLTATCTAMPYTVSSTSHGRLVYVGQWPSGGLEGCVALVDMVPEDLDLAKEQCLEAARRGAVACIFIDPYLDDGSRRIVVTGAEGYSFGPGSPPPIPCVSVSRRAGAELRRLAGRGARVEVEASISHGSRALIVEGVLEGSVEEEVLVTAHHDHWLAGFTDNCLGVAFLVEAARRLPRNLRRRVRLVSFGAEEQGAPGFSPWYWIHGSRSYVRLRGDSIDLIEAVLNVDVLARPPLTIASSDAKLRALLSRAAEALSLPYNVELDNPYCDSYSFTMAGLPSATLHTFDQCTPFYHSDRDLRGQVDAGFVGGALKALEASIVALARGEVKVRGARRVGRMLSDLSRMGASRPLVRALRAKALGSPRGELRLASALYRAVAVAPYTEPGPFKVEFAPELRAAREVEEAEGALRALEEGRVDEALSRLRGLGRVAIAPGVEERLPSLRVDEAVRLAEGGHVEGAIKALRSSIREARAELKLALKRLVERVGC